MTGNLQIKNKKYYVVLNITVNGKRKQKWIPTGLDVRGNKREAQKILGEKIREYEEIEEYNKSCSDETIPGFAAKWVSRERGRVDEVTLQGYKILAEKHIIPYFSRDVKPINKVSRKDIQEFICFESEYGRSDGKGGLSPKSVKEIKNVLHLILEEAIRDELIQSNPCSEIILPKKGPPVAQFYTESQLHTLMVAAKDEIIYPIICLAIIYGLRRSELAGIKLDSVDFENNIFTIKHTVVKVTTEVEKDSTKTVSSRRSFPLTDGTRELFMRAIAEKERYKRIYGDQYFDSDYVFCWPDGRRITPDYITKRFKKILKQNDLPDIRFHDLRHSCASLLLNKGHTLKEVQEWMGHADITVTANIYGHIEAKTKISMANDITSGFEI